MTDSCLRKKISQTIMPSSDTLSALMSIENSSRRYFRVEENGSGGLIRELKELNGTIMVK